MPIIIPTTFRAAPSPDDTLTMPRDKQQEPTRPLATGRSATIRDAINRIDTPGEKHVGSIRPRRLAGAPCIQLENAGIGRKIKLMIRRDGQTRVVEAEIADIGNSAV